jgi:phosphoenolpyruvate---glycerone phosphotransferase subunit DhaM
MAGGDAALVGIVIASHSAKIADGVVELAGQMAGPEVRLIAAGGAIDGSLGTDATRIADAIARADAGAGVVVLADLGSAVMSAKLALDMVEPATMGRTRLSGGPLVEGAVVAAVQASAGDDLAAVLAAAEDAAHMPKDVS